MNCKAVYPKFMSHENDPFMITKPILNLQDAIHCIYFPELNAGKENQDKNTQIRSVVEFSIHPNSFYLPFYRAVVTI